MGGGRGKSSVQEAQAGELEFDTAWGCAISSVKRHDGHYWNEVGIEIQKLGQTECKMNYKYTKKQ